MTGKKKILSPYYVVTVIILVFLAVFFLFPLYWIVTGSVKEKSDIIIKSGEMVKWIPTTVSWDNFARLFKSKTELFGIGMPMAIRWLFNSVFISATAMILTCITASLAGYVLAKKRFWGKRLIFSLFVCAMALPKQVILIPLMKEMSDLGLIHSVWGSMFAVICPVVGWPFGVFMMRQFYQGIPDELCEAARIDGMNEYQIWAKIMLPLSKPALSTLTIFTFVNTWNDFLGPLIYLKTEAKKTLQLGLKMFLSQYSSEYGLIMAASVLSLIPVLIVFLALQQYFVEGIAATGVKG